MFRRGTCNRPATAVPPTANSHTGWLGDVPRSSQTRNAEAHDFTVDAETGDERWTASVGFWGAEDVNVSDDGDRVYSLQIEATVR